MEEDPEIAAQVYSALLHPEWAESRFWGLFDLPQKAITEELAYLYAHSAEITPERIAAVEAAYRRADERAPQRLALLTYLAGAYRRENRRDEDAQGVYATLFGLGLASGRDDADNTAYLANLYAEEARGDAAACTVYAAMSRREPAPGGPSPEQWTLRIARAHIAAGRVNGDTLPYLRRAAAFAPGDAEIAAAVAAAAARHSHPDESVFADLHAALPRETELTPVFTARGWEWASVVRTLALGWGRARRTDEAARAVYARANDLCPGEKRFYLFHARALMQASDYSEQTVPVYEKALAASPDDATLRTALAHAYVAANAGQESRHTQAIGIWEDLYRQGLGWPEMTLALAQAYTFEERVGDVALAVWSQVTENDAKNGRLRVRLGREYKSRGDFETALNWYREAAKLLPRDFEAQYQAGLLLRERSGDQAAAEKLLRKAVKLNAKHANAHFVLGEALLAQDKKDEARAVFQFIIETLDAKHTLSLLHLAKLNLRYDMESIANAEALYDQALELDPNQPETYRQLAELYREKGQHDDEKQALESYLKLCAGDAEAHRQLADLYIRRGDFAHAEGTLRQVIALGSGDKKIYTLLGEVMVQARDKAA